MHTGHVGYTSFIQHLQLSTNCSARIITRRKTEAKGRFILRRKTVIACLKHVSSQQGRTMLDQAMIKLEIKI